MKRLIDWLLGRRRKPLFVIETEFARMWNVDAEILALHTSMATQRDYKWTAREMTADEIRQHH